MINSDIVRSAEFAELRRTSAELKATLTEPLSLQHQDSDARAIGSWDEIASVIEGSSAQAEADREASRRAPHPTP